MFPRWDTNRERENREILTAFHATRCSVLIKRIRDRMFLTFSIQSQREQQRRRNLILFRR